MNHLGQKSSKECAGCAPTPAGGALQPGTTGELVTRELTEWRAVVLDNRDGTARGGRDAGGGDPGDAAPSAAAHQLHVLAATQAIERVKRLPAFRSYCPQSPVPSPSRRLPYVNWQYLLPIWLAIACYFVAEVGRPWSRRAVGRSAQGRCTHPGRTQGSRSRWDAIWLVGSLLAWIHIVLAYRIAHGGSHAEALRHTAEVTRQAVGVSVEAGLYVNFAFACLWTLDACGRLSGRYDRWPLRLKRLIHLFLAFILFQATVVFGSGPVRWIAAAGFAVLLGVRLVTWNSRSS